MIELPPLPEPELYEGVLMDSKGKFTGTEDGYRADQMHEYAEQAVEQAIERCAQAAGPEDSYVDEWFKAKADSVRRIRALKEKQA